MIIITYFSETVVHYSFKHNMGILSKVLFTLYEVQLKITVTDLFLSIKTFKEVR